MSETRPERERRKSQVDVPNGLRATQRGVSEPGEAQGWGLCALPVRDQVCSGNPTIPQAQLGVAPEDLGCAQEQKGGGKGDTFHRQTDRDTR